MTPEPEACRWLDSLPDGLVVIDASGRLEWANSAASRLFGWSLEDRGGQPVFDLVHPDDLNFALMSLASVQGKEVGTPIELRLRCRDGWKLMEAVGSPSRHDRSRASVVLTFRDLTARRRWEIGHGATDALRAVLHNASALLMLVGEDGVVTAVSASISRLLGLDPEQVEGSPLAELVCPSDRAGLRRAMRLCVDGPAPAGGFETGGAEAGGCGAEAGDGGGRVTVEVSLMSSAGTPVPYELSLVAMTSDPVLSGLVISGHSLTKLRLAQKALADLAHRDALTGLPNRSAVDDLLEDLLSRADPVDVAFVDLDGFKELNDTDGHLTGDRMLQVVAERLSAAVRTKDMVARYGGDEFVVVAAGLDAGVLAARLESVFAHPLDLGSCPVAVPASVGVARSRPGETPTDVLERADRAMYSQKALRREAEVGGWPRRKAPGGGKGPAKERDWGEEARGGRGPGEGEALAGAAGHD